MRHVAARISPAYLAQQKVLHASPRGYGGRGDKWAPVVVQLAQEYGAASVLDYGCGQGSLVRAVNRLAPSLCCREYDPAIPGKDGAFVGFADLVNCTDVLEHVEPDRLAAVLAHLRLLARKVLWLVVSTTETAKVLEDGRNAHLIVQPGAWWQARLLEAGFRLAPIPAIARQRTDKEWMATCLP